MHRLLIMGLAICFSSSATVVAARAADTAYFWDLDPGEIRQLVASPQVVVTRRGITVDAYCRCPVVLKPYEIPKAMKDAIIAVEDRRYFDHGGVDLISLISVVKSGFSRGGSTIPMQLLKNLVLSDLRRSDAVSRLERKGIELLHAGVLDGALGKEELLAAYLNQIEFGGPDRIGLYRAALYFFRKEPKDLNLYESAMLAGMVQAPARLNPLKETTRQRAHERAELVLQLMVDQKKITAKERGDALKVRARPGIMREFEIQPQAFVEWVRSVGSEYVEPDETLRFFVSFDPRLQQIAEHQLRSLANGGSVPKEYDSALVMMDGVGHVRAMVGALDWTETQFNNAVKGARQPGSTAKISLMVAACIAGKGPNAIIEDRPDAVGWPSNGSVGYRGKTTLREAIAFSRNAAAVRLETELGVDKVVDAARKLGIESGPNPDRTFVLGTFATSPLVLTAAYAVIANGGFRVTPTGILAVMDGRGVVRSKLLRKTRERVIPEKCANSTKTMLGEVVRSGTGRAAAARNGDSFGKTGTSSGNADAWFVGWNHGRVLGIWMGRRGGSDQSTALAGAGAPAELFRRIQNSVNELPSRRPDATARIADGHPKPRATPLPPLRPKDRVSENF